ncbi:hypothetical protein OS493_039806, partial [Desmophyllum pertusum]
VGLDPGIDYHVGYGVAFDDAKAERSTKIKSFRSYCGGETLPAPEHADNPLRYKFRLWKWQQVGLLLEESKFNRPFPGSRLECYPNRDSTEYGKLYNITTANTLLQRGTLCVIEVAGLTLSLR